MLHLSWHGTRGRQHAYLQDGDLAFADDVITFVGRHYAGHVDTTIDGHTLMVMPGLIDVHSHPTTEPFYRGLREDHGLPQCI
jgi:5-methylthioadenosine/S-adenosylhomocysteine deaminase